MTTNYNRSTVDSLLTDLYWTRTQSDNKKVDKLKIDQYMYYLCTKSLKIALKYFITILDLNKHYTKQNSLLHYMVQN